jgi:xanthine dehydrogenase YagR molybdenum-binding subunit
MHHGGAGRSWRHTAADKLGVALDKISVELGDSELPPAPVDGGSNTTASVCNVV